MSYIIDALKKLEQEKARKARTPGSITIAGELFSDHQPNRPKKNVRNSTIAILFAVALTFAITWYFLKGSGNKLLSKKTLTTATYKSTATSSPDITQSQQLAPKVMPPAPQKNVAELPKQQQPITVAKKLPGRPVISPDDQTQIDRSRIIPPSRKTKTIHAPTMVKTVPQFAPAPADIQVSGVAWQDEKSMRRAVVNGLLLKEGAIISGAQLKEILPDRVRFERSGSLFEVTFVSNSGQTGK